MIQSLNNEESYKRVIYCSQVLENYGIPIDVVVIILKYVHTFSMSYGRQNLIPVYNITEKYLHENCLDFDLIELNDVFNCDKVYPFYVNIGSIEKDIHDHLNNNVFQILKRRNKSYRISKKSRITLKKQASKSRKRLIVYTPLAKKKRTSDVLLFFKTYDFINNKPVYLGSKYLSELPNPCSLFDVRHDCRYVEEIRYLPYIRYESKKTNKSIKYNELESGDILWILPKGIKQPPVNNYGVECIISKLIEKINIEKKIYE